MGFFKALDIKLFWVYNCQTDLNWRSSMRMFFIIVLLGGALSGIAHAVKQGDDCHTRQVSTKGYVTWLDSTGQRMNGFANCESRYRAMK